MMNALSGRGPLEQLHKSLIYEEGLRQGTEMGVFDASKNCHQLLSHLLRIKLALGQIILYRYLSLIHPSNIPNTYLDLPLVKSGLPAHMDKVVLVERPSQILRPIPYPPLNFTAPVLKLEGQIATPPFCYPVILRRHQKE